MRIKVHGGVIGGDSKGLCASCRYGAVREDAGGAVGVWCSSYAFIGGGSAHPVRKPIVRCNEYKPTDSVSLGDLERIAWQITTDKKTGAIGFMTPTERAFRGDD